MPVFLPGEFHGQRSLAGYSPWVAKSWIQLSVTHLGTKRTCKSQILVLAKSRFQKFCFNNQKLNIAFVFLFLFAFLLSARAGLILGTQLQSWLWTGPRHKNVRKKDLCFKNIISVIQKHTYNIEKLKPYCTDSLMIHPSPLSWPLFHTMIIPQKCGLWASLIAQLVKNLPARQETSVWFLGQEDRLEKG